MHRTQSLNNWTTFLDVDGVIYDTLPLYVKAWCAAFSEVGIKFTDKDVYEQEGRPGRETVLNAFERENREPNSSEIELVLSTKKGILDSISKWELIPGIKELVARVALTGSVFVVTGSTRSGLKNKLQQDFGEYFTREHIIAGRDYKYGKPHPEPYELALKRAQVAVSQAIVIENAPLGIQSATSAGIKCLAINTGILSDNVLLESGAIRVYPNCTSLVDSWDEIVKLIK